MSSADASTETAPEEAVETDEVREALVAELTERLGADAVVASHVDAGRDAWLRVRNEAWADLAEALRRSAGFDYFCFLSAIDWLPSPFGRSMDSAVDSFLEQAEAKEPEPVAPGITGGDTRFQVLARVHSTRRGLGITLKADTADDEPSIATWTATYPGANWHERETAEMFGITFLGHPNPTKLYLPGDFEGYPLRKDFPLVARIVKPWPGIVDVERMPGEAATGDGDEAGGE